MTNLPLRLHTLVTERTHDLRRTLGWDYHPDGLGISFMSRRSGEPLAWWVHQRGQFARLGGSVAEAVFFIEHATNALAAVGPHRLLAEDRQNITTWLEKGWVGNAAYLTVAAPTLQALLDRLALYERQLQEHVGAVCEKCGVDDACDGECVWIADPAREA